MSDQKTDPVKSTKAKGPIRTEAVVPVVIIFAATYLYFTFMFDAHLRKGAEWTATYIHGAEVNIASIKTSFLRGTFQLSGLQVTDKETPTQNLIELGEIRFAFLWDALLRAKFVVNDAGIEQIQIYSPRKKTGWVRPPEPPSTEPSAMAKLEKNALEQTKKDYETNVLGDIAKLLEGTDDKEVLNQIKETLQSEQKIKALQEELKGKEKAWKDRLENLPKKDEFEAIAKKAKTLKFNSKDPKQFAADLKEAQKLAKEADAKFDEIKNTTDDLKGDINKYNAEFNQIDDMIKKDIDDIEKRLKLPDLDMADFSKNLFGRTFATKLASVQKYMEVGRKYMPPPKDPNATKNEIVPRARGQGENVKFRVTKGYPLFWLQKASISSEPTAEGFSGKISGTLTDVTTDPTAINKPTVLDVQGDFPKSEIYSTKLVLNIDHRNEPVETMTLNVGSFPLYALNLVSSSDVNLKMEKAKGISQMSAVLKNQILEVDLKNDFTDINYDLQAKNKTVHEALNSILGGIPVVNLNARATGTWDDIDVNMNSNLGKELAAGLKKFVKEKVDAIKKKVRAQIDERIQAEKDKLTAEYNKVKSQVDGALKSKTAELEKAKKDVKDVTSSKSSDAKNKAKDELKEKGKKLLKGIKF